MTHWIMRFGALAMILSVGMVGCAAPGQYSKSPDLDEMQQQMARLEADQLVMEAGPVGTGEPNNSDHWQRDPDPQSLRKTCEVAVQFKIPFPQKPTIVLSLCNLSVAPLPEQPGESGQVRVGVEAKDITVNGFTVVFSTAGRTYVGGVSATYIAYAKKDNPSK